MPTMIKRIERLEDIYPSLDSEIETLLRELSALTGESEAKILTKFLQEREEE